MSFYDNYKKFLSHLLGSICLITPMVRPWLKMLGFVPEEVEVWSSLNVWFLAIGVILLWGEIVNLAKALQNRISTMVSKTNVK